jgi:hypothetical protein
MKIYISHAIDAVAMGYPIIWTKPEKNERLTLIRTVSGY